MRPSNQCNRPLTKKCTRHQCLFSYKCQHQARPFIAVPEPTGWSEPKRTGRAPKTTMRRSTRNHINNRKLLSWKRSKIRALWPTTTRKPKNCIGGQRIDKHRMTLTLSLHFTPENVLAQRHSMKKHGLEWHVGSMQGSVPSGACQKARNPLN